MLSLSYKILYHFVKSNKLLFGFLCILQIVSLFATLFVFSYYDSYAKENVKYDESKTYKVYFNDSSATDKKVEKQIENFKKECKLNLSEISINTDVEDYKVQFDCIYHPTTLGFGRYFSKDEFKTNRHVIITEDYTLVQGDTVKIENEKYTVVGIDGSNLYSRLPAICMKDVKHKIEGVSVILKDYPSDAENDKIISQLTKCFENSEVSSPVRINAVDNLFQDTSTLLYIGMFFLAMINVAFAYVYILEKSKNIMYIYRLNGATKTNCILIISNVIFVIAIVSLLLGCLVTRCILPYVIDFAQVEDFTYSLGVKDYIIMMILYLVVVAITSLPMIIRYVKNITISEKARVIK